MEHKMEHGFFHPSIGYWQTLSTPTQAQRSAYPAGTREVPLKPGNDFAWDGSAWVPTPPVPPTPEQVDAMRRAAYQAEADPLFFKAQRGEATMEQWLAKINEIKARYPA